MDPIHREDLIVASTLKEEDFDVLIAILMECKTIDRTAWEERRELNFTGMASRASEYTRKVIRRMKMAPGVITVPARVEPERLLVSAPAPAAPSKKQAPRTESPIASMLRIAWNETVTSPIPKIQRLSPKRIRAAEIAVKTYGEDHLRAAFTAIESTPFCRGDNERGWTATFDWALRGDNHLRALEGGYTAAVTTGQTTRSRANKAEMSEFSARLQPSQQGPSLHPFALQEPRSDQ
jgi:hypothetical protein|tara:strand:- start:20 stop:727 length:708 start_codon:yes stop_codon:yes gene_type:complete